MEKRLSGTSHGASLAAPLLDLLHVGNPKDKISPELKAALQLLQLKNLDNLENHLLATDAFLKPWSQFRDGWFLVQTEASSRASPPGQLQGTGVLWYYTSFLEGELRYDARCDDSSSTFTTDETKYGTFNDQHWGVEEHEKMLYAWLLQEFRVGKARNPFGFKYFEHRNVVAAWKAIFIPIVNAVRNSYDVKGRRHYGRLATFIEDRYPSRLAFPEGNVVAPLKGAPYRMVALSRVQDTQPWLGSSPKTIPREHQPITKKEYAEFEKELRVVYPKYGQVVERPRFTTRMEDWLASQKLRAQEKKRAKELNGKKPLTLQKGGGKKSPLFGCRGVEEHNEDSSQAASMKTSTPRRSLNVNASSSSLRSPSSSMPSPKTPTRKIPHGVFGYRVVPVDANEKKSHKKAKPGIDRIDSDGVYSSIRNLNPFTKDGRASLEQTRELKQRASWNSEASSMAQKSAIPHPLFGQTGSTRKPGRGSPEASSFVRAINEAKARAPSYEGNGYERDISPSFLERNNYAVSSHRAHNEAQPDQLSQVQESVHPINEQGVAYHIPQPLPWPGQTPQFQPPYSTAWLSESDGEETPAPPPIPARNPQRYNSIRDFHSVGSSRRSSLQPSVYPTLGPRIVSVENIRAHTAISPQASNEDLTKVDEEEKKNMLPSLPLRTYNSHMFPRQDRRGTPLNESDTGRYEAGGEYELEVLKQSD